MSLTGILLDVSGSMRSNIGSGTDEEGGPWVRSIFQVIDDLIKHDVSTNDRVFAIGFGADCRRKQEINKPATSDHINAALDILERNGARNVRNWATVDLIQSVLSDNMAALILMKLQSDEEFLRKFVDEFLPSACRNKVDYTPSTREVVGVGICGAAAVAVFGSFALPVLALSRIAAPFAENLASERISRKRPATQEDVKEVVKKVKDYLKDDDNATCTLLADVRTNSVFIGFGADCSKQIFDVIGTVKEINKPATRDHINAALDILERNGARNVRNWATVDLIQSVLSDNMAELMLNKLKSDREFLNKFVYEFLPSACRNKVEYSSYSTREVVGDAVSGGLISLAGHALRIAASLGEDALSKGISSFQPATQQDIKEVVEKVKDYLKDDDNANCTLLTDVTMNSVFGVQEASEIIHGCVDEKELTVERSRELLKNVEPYIYIYGGMPLYESLDKATELFQQSTADNKLLFVLSDGEPTDGPIDDTDLKFIQVVFKLRRAEVTIVSCFITKLANSQPKTLYDQMTRDWEGGAKFLFSLSSTWETRRLPSAILFKRGWEINSDSNETKLFVQANHPDNLKEACNMAKDVVYNADSLSELLVSVDLDLYINQSNKEYEEDKGEERREGQTGNTCYAHAIATMLHLAMKRILSRESREGQEDRYPQFDTLKEEMIDSFGDDSAIIPVVLDMMCAKYGLRWKDLEIDVKLAKDAIREKRPVLALFLYRKPCTRCNAKIDELEMLKDFFYHEKNRTTVLTKKQYADILGKRCTCLDDDVDAPIGGHAVVLTSYNRYCLTLMNSWGCDWGDNGFFRVENAEVLDLHFIDIYWTEDDLTAGEREYYRQHGSEVAHQLMTSLKGLQKTKYTCPKCDQSSLVTKFKGTLSKVECPNCLKEFSTYDNDGNILALNIYLTSLNR